MVGEPQDPPSPEAFEPASVPTLHISFDRNWSGHSRVLQLLPQPKPCLLWSMERRKGEKTLDKASVASYPTPSMRSPLSPDMLTRGPHSVHSWTERGDLTNAGEEEGCQEGDEEEEVSAPGKGGVDRSPSPLVPPKTVERQPGGIFFRGLTALIAESSVPNV